MRTLLILFTFVSLSLAAENKVVQFMPEPYGLAEIVGKWVWVTFAEIPSDKIRAGLSPLGLEPARQRLEQPTNNPRNRANNPRVARV